MLGRDRIQYKTREQVLLMRRAGLLVATRSTPSAPRSSPA
jgi:hypothetical protein